jgi:hypothetical protein
MISPMLHNHGGNWAAAKKKYCFKTSVIGGAGSPLG